tara:strand:+ start:484 stop:1098 length:615 start_codon:yes stop_codon:yes gene_type:complete
MYYCLDDALTLTLWNIKQFAPKLLAKKVDLIKDGKNNKSMIERPVIQMKNVKVKKKGKETIITKNMGEYGYLELKPETLDFDMVVRVITPATSNQTLKAIQQNRAKEVVGIVVELLNTGIPPEEVFQEFPTQEIMRNIKIAFGYGEKLSADTKKSAQKKENLQKIKQIQEKLALLTQQSNETIQKPAQPTDAPAPEVPQQLAIG